MLEKVVTGGQTGADQAGWRAAKAAGIATGGWMPKGFLTEEGPRPEFAELYGAREIGSRQYPSRTRQNVYESCVVLWFGYPKSPGGSLTINLARSRASFVYVVETPHGEWQPAHIARHVANALDQQRHFPKGPPGQDRSIMVAGNRESSAPGIGAWVEAYLAEVFRLMRLAEGADMRAAAERSRRVREDLDLSGGGKDE